MTCNHGFEDGAYVLGALSPADRAAFELHLPGCATCREAVAGVAVLPGLLRRLGQPEEDYPATGDRITMLMKALKQKRRARRRRGAAIVLSAFCTALVLGVGAASLPERRPDMVAMQPVSAETRVTAEASVKDTAGGMVITMHCSYPENGTSTRAYTFRLMAVGTDGTVEQVGSWKAAPGEEITITGTIQFGRDTLSRLELRSRDGRTLLILEMSGD